MTAPLLPDIFARWFAGRGWQPRAHQLELLAKAHAGRSVLLIAPTGGGKTLAGFLPTLVELHERDSRPRNLKSTGRALVRSQGLHTLYISPLKALGGRHRAQPGNPGQGDGPAGAAGDAHRRHARVQAPTSAPRSARHLADHARAARAAARERRRALSVRHAQARGARRTAFAHHLQARRSAVARSGAAVRAGAAAHHRRPVRHRGRTGRTLPLPGAAAARRRCARRSGGGASRRAAAGHDARHGESICPGPVIRPATRSAKSTI